MKPARVALLVLFALTLAAADASAQANYAEGFENPGGLQTSGDGPLYMQQKGWVFRNQSAPKGTYGFYEIPDQFGAIQAHSGDDCIGSDTGATDAFVNGDVSLWALLPPVPNQRAGDTIGVHVNARMTDDIDALEIRYSPSGGTSTGSGAHDVGDYTVLLKLVKPIPKELWTLQTAVVPGPGRLALRYVVEDACNWSLGMCFGAGVGIDTLTVGPPPAAPCNLPPPVAPGATVTWTAAGGPYVVCEDYLVPEGSTVFVEAGTSIAIDEGRTIDVRGHFETLGMAQAPVVLGGGLNFFAVPLLVRKGASAHLTGARFDCRVHGQAGSTILVRDCVIDGGSVSTQPATVDHTGPYVEITGSHFQAGGEARVTDGTLVLRDCTFDQAGAGLLRGYLVAERLDFDGGGGLDFTRERHGQPVWLDDLVITGVNGAALDLAGSDFALGPGNLLVGNKYPVALGGGLARGSVVPASGNAVNAVLIDGFFGSATWANVATPYRIDGFFDTGSSTEIEPGARIELGPGAGLALLGGLRALGVPSAPIQFLPAVPGQPWSRIMSVANRGRTRFESCVFRGAQEAVQADDTIVQVQDSVFQGNQVGAAATTFGLIRARKSRFTQNGVGVRVSPALIGHGSADLDGATGVNAIAGNATGFLNENVDPHEARRNWWGSPSGPQHPLNPGGTGDAVAGPGASAVKVLPFATTPPDFSDHPPVVRLEPIADVLDAGSQLVLTWTAEDDGAIVAQRILHSPHGLYDYSVLAELPAGQRTARITVPVAPPSSILDASAFKVVAVDDAGQEGFDERFALVPYTEDLVGFLAAEIAVAGDWSGPFVQGTTFPVCWDHTGASGTIDAWWDLVGDGGGDSLGGAHTGVDCLSLGITMPWISSDTVRLGVMLHVGAGGRSIVAYSDEFTVRPDPRIGNAAPLIDVVSPTRGSVHAGGTTVPIAWIASDDDELRSFAVQVSADGGRSWSFVARELPGDATSYDWMLPPGDDFAELRVRVVARDLWYQSSSDAVDVLVAPGAIHVCQPSLGQEGPGALAMALCGAPLASGASAPLDIEGALPGGPVWLALSATHGALPLGGGTLVPFPGTLVVPLTANGLGEVHLLVPGGSGTGASAVVYAQAIALAPSVPGALALSNALAIQFLP